MTLPADSEEQRLSDVIARRAYELWELRGRPWGSPEQDWYAAVRELDNGELRATDDDSALPFSDLNMEPMEL